MDKEKITIRKASDLKKRSLSKEDIYDVIANLNNTPTFKHVIPPDMYVSEEVIMSIINDGFKVYKGNIFNFDQAWIIEW